MTTTVQYMYELNYAPTLVASGEAMAPGGGGRGAGGAPGFSGVLVQSGSWNAGRFAGASVSTCIDVSPSSSGSRDSASSHFSLAISAPPIFNALRNVLVSKGESNNLQFVLTPRVSHRPKV